MDIVKPEYETWSNYVLRRKDLIQIPCGQCIECRLNYAREWAVRCMFELKTSPKAYFITLTYSDLMAPRSFVYDGKEEVPVLTLRKKHFQLFMKRLRKEYAKKSDEKLRYFACGEYGSQTYRPHYHAIIFNLQLDDLKFYKNTTFGNLYTSDWLNSIWTGIDDFGYRRQNGYVVIGNVSFESCAYVARYTAKKANTFGDDFYKKFNIEKPFILMSRRPGLGYKYFSENQEKYYTGNVYVTGKDGSFNVQLPDYFFKKLETLNPEIFRVLKEKRLVNSDNFLNAKFGEGKNKKRDYGALLDAEHDSLLARSRALKRNKI